MEDVMSKVSADPANPFYVAIQPHLEEAFKNLPGGHTNATWLDVCLCMEEVLKSPDAVTVSFKSSDELDKIRANILSDFSFTKVVLKESSVVCIDPSDAAFIKSKYL